MKNSTFFKAAFLFVAASITHSVHAQIDDGTDLTDRIINNSFESSVYTDLGPYPGDPENGIPAGSGKRQQPEGWIYESVMTGSNDAVIMAATSERKSADGVQHFNSWSSQYISSNIYQTIEDLPAGAYQLTAALRVTSKDYPEYITNQHVYGINSDGLVFNSPSLTLAGLGPNDENWQDLEVLIIMKNSGTLTIGATSQGDNPATTPKGWFQCDYFRLTYLGDESEYGVQYYQALIEDALQTLLRYNTSELSAAASQSREDAISYKYENDGTTDLGLFEQVIDSLQHTLSIVETNRQAVQALQDLIYEIVEDYEPNPWEGFDQLEKVYIKAFDYFDNPTGKNEQGNLYATEDVESMISELKTAIRTYRLKAPASQENPADFTWVISSPQFTKAGGNPSLVADASFEGWAYDNNPATGSQYRLNNVNGKNCWNSWSDNWVSMNVFQDLEDMPAGFYTFSCYQTNDGSSLTDQHAYIATIAGTSDSPYATYSFYLDPDPDKGSFSSDSKWEDPLETGKILVGSDGKIRIGFASTSSGSGSSGWFCITDCELKYYGMTENAYEEALQNLILSAQELLGSDLLTSDKNALNSAIESAKIIDTSDPESAEKGLAGLNSAVQAAKEAINALSAYKAGSYATALEMAHDDAYPAEIIGLMKKIINDQDQLLASDTLQSTTLPYLSTLIDQYLSYTEAYQACEQFAVYKEGIDIPMTQILQAALMEQTAKVSQDVTLIEPAKKQFLSLIPFAEVYILGIQYSYNEEYLVEMLTKLAQTCEIQIGIVSEDHSQALAAETEISKVLGEMRFAGLGIEAGENTEVTDLVIVNPTIESESGSVVPDGWTIEKIDGNTYTASGQHWSGESDNRYLDSWNATAGVLRFTAQQTVKGIPNGTYRLEAAGRSSGSGAHLFAKVADGIRLTQIINDGNSGGNIWEEAEEGSEIYQVHDEKGYGWNRIEVAHINVNDHILTLGCSNDPAFTGSGIAWTGTWYSVDDFKLYYTSTEFTSSVEHIGMDPDSPLVVYADNGYLTVVGAKNYTIYHLNGTPIPVNIQLSPGIYIVKAADKVAKIAVK